MLIQLAVTTLQIKYLSAVLDRANGMIVSNSAARSLPPPKNEEFVAAEQLTFERETFDTFTVDISKNTIRFYLEDKENNRLQSLTNLRRLLNSQHEDLLFATNGGMFSPTGEPLGLYVENGEELYPLNSRTGSGNFYMKPNGVFMITDRGAFIIESTEYAILNHLTHVDYATQSGPLLVHNAQINSAFDTHSRSKFIRSGVGLLTPTKVVFAISRNTVTFMAFARLFKLRFNCNDALYLDGAISRMYLPQLHRLDQDGEFGAMIAVSRPTAE